MLDVLNNIEEILPELVRDEDKWQTLDIDYDFPRVERVWREYLGYRVCLHKIHPCEEALWHPHPWPSAVKIVSGRYEMGICQKEGQVPISMMVLSTGSSYDMTDPHTWHYVKPLTGVVYSLMVMGKPYTEVVYDHAPFGAGKELSELSYAAKREILDRFTPW